MREGAGRCVGVVDDERERGGVRGDARPRKRGRDLGAVARVPLRIGRSSPRTPCWSPRWWPAPGRRRATRTRPRRTPRRRARSRIAARSTAPACHAAGAARVVPGGGPGGALGSVRRRAAARVLPRHPVVVRAVEPVAGAVGEAARSTSGTCSATARRRWPRATCPSARRGGSSPTCCEHWARLGLDPPDVVAHDYGGAVALRAHLLHGATYRSLALVDVVALAPWGSDFFRLVAEHADVFAASAGRPARGAGPRVRRRRGPPPLRAEDVDRSWTPWLGASGQAAFYRQIAQADQRYTDEVEPLYPTLDLPVQVVWGTEDTWIPVDRAHRLAELIPGARLDLVEGAGHLSSSMPGASDRDPAPVGSIAAEAAGSTRAQTRRRRSARASAAGRTAAPSSRAAPPRRARRRRTRTGSAGG